MVLCDVGGVVWCGVVWCGVVWCGVVWCGVGWCGVGWGGVGALVPGGVGCGVWGVGFIRIVSWERHSLRTCPEKSRQAKVQYQGNNMWTGIQSHAQGEDRQAACESTFSTNPPIHHTTPYHPTCLLVGYKTGASACKHSLHRATLLASACV